MRQCHVLGLVNYELQSLIKGNGHYAVMGVYSPSEEGKQSVFEEKPHLYAHKKVFGDKLK